MVTQYREKIFLYFVTIERAKLYYTKLITQVDAVLQPPQHSKTPEDLYTSQIVLSRVRAQTVHDLGRRHHWTNKNPQAPKKGDKCQ